MISNYHMLCVVIIIYINILFLSTILSETFCGFSHLDKENIIPFVANLSITSKAVFFGQLLSINCDLEADCLNTFRVLHYFKAKNTSEKKLVIRSQRNADKCLVDISNKKRKVLVFANYKSNKYIILKHVLPKLSKKLLSVVEDYSCKNCGRPLRAELAAAYNVTEGKNLTITCRGVGRPRVKLKWFKNGIEVQLKENTGGKISKLKFKVIRKSDKGVYQCQAYNDVLCSNIYNTTLNVLTIIDIPLDKEKIKCRNQEYCFHNGTCYIYKSQRKKFCSCLDGYSGIRCATQEVDLRDLEVRSSKEEKQGFRKNQGKIMLLFLVILFVILIAVMMVLIFAVLRERKELFKLIKMKNKKNSMALMKNEIELTELSSEKPEEVFLENGNTTPNKRADNTKISQHDPDINFNVSCKIYVGKDTNLTNTSQNDSNS